MRRGMGRGEEAARRLCRVLSRRFRRVRGGVGAYFRSTGGRMPASARMVVVANRLPVSRAGAGRGGKSRWVVSPGGLVTALGPIVRDRGGTWVGWTGSTGKTPRPFSVDGIGIRPVPIRA